MKLVVLDVAQTELEEARDYYLQHASPRIAAAFVSEYERSARRIMEYPLVGSLLSHRQRVLPLRSFPYSIIYRVGTEVIVVYAIAHQRRRPGFWRGRG